jgi:hypothetical protein
VICIEFLTSSAIRSLGVIAPNSVLGFFTVGLKKASRVRFLDMTVLCVDKDFRITFDQNTVKKLSGIFLRYYVQNINY